MYMVTFLLKKPCGAICMRFLGIHTEWGHLRALTILIRSCCTTRLAPPCHSYHRCS